MPLPDPLGFAIDIVSLIVVLVMALYGVRLLSTTKHGQLEKSWIFVGWGSLFFVLGVIAFGFVSADSSVPGGWLEPTFNLGGISMIVGGSLFALGFRVQCEVFKIKFSYEKPKEKIKDLT